MRRHEHPLCPLCGKRHPLPPWSRACARARIAFVDGFVRGGLLAHLYALCLINCA